MSVPVKHAKKRMHKIRQILVCLYAAVVVIVALALFGLLQDDHASQSVPDVTALDPDVLAVLSSIDGNEITVPMRDIESIIPAPQSPAWQTFAAAWPTDQRPKIAVVIDDLGLLHSASDRLAAMPGPYTLAYLPYAEDLPSQTAKVRAAGHELMVHLPMEPKNQSTDPGPNALLAGLDHQEFERRIDWNLKRFDGFVGVNNHMGSLMTEQAGQMVRVMVHLRRGGYLFLDSLTSPKSVASRAAAATGVPHIKRDIFLDNIQEKALIEQQLAKAERIARRRGYAVAIGHPYDATLSALQDWRSTLDERGFVLVPISLLVAETTKAALVAQVPEVKTE